MVVKKKARVTKVKIQKVKPTFRNPRIDISSGENSGITSAIWKYLDLNRDKTTDCKGKNIGNTGVCIVPYFNYLASRKDKFTGTVDDLDSLLEIMLQNKLVRKLDRQNIYCTHFKCAL